MPTFLKSFESVIQLLSRCFGIDVFQGFTNWIPQAKFFQRFHIDGFILPQRGAESFRYLDQTLNFLNGSAPELIHTHDARHREVSYEGYRPGREVGKVSSC